LKCCECDRQVKGTIHTLDGATVDYYTYGEVGKEVRVVCVDCYDPTQDYWAEGR
jgi:hypothetical protein